MFAHRRFPSFLVAAIALVSVATPARAQSISPSGERLVKLLDGMDVEHLWQAKEYVHWKSGKPVDKPVNDEKPHTHCSAFAAAVADRLKIYLLHPPEHGASYLANAQCDWLPGPGAAQGWQPVATPEDAQALANAGNLVVAVYKEEDPKKHGHAAVVRPAEKTRANRERRTADRSGRHGELLERTAGDRLPSSSWRLGQPTRPLLCPRDRLGSRRREAEEIKISYLASAAAAQRFPDRADSASLAPALPTGQPSGQCCR